MAAVEPNILVTRGCTSYRPRDRSTDSNRQLFQPRRPRPGRIEIRTLTGWEGACDRSTQKDIQRSGERLSLKLATTRESARRFLKSVIATPTNPPERAKGKRRSWSPVKRTESGGSSRSASTSEEAGNMRAGIRNSISGPMSVHPARPRLGTDASSTSTASSVTSSVASRQTTNASTGPSPRVLSRRGSVTDGMVPAFCLDEEKPIASGNGVSMGLHLTEPVLFLQGFENTEHAPGNTAMLRGSLHVRVQKTAKIKTITLKFKGQVDYEMARGDPASQDRI